ncbi:MAG TPA: SPOR domain-containing protein, partial [Steroidobacteraceae bacterium]|nr:SPOR domain-containing protein [Steroidobacteraceae bacterium]
APPAPALTLRPPSGGEGPPVRSYTIELNAHGASAAPMQLSGPAAGSEAAPAQARAPVQAKAQAQAQAPTEAPAQAPGSAEAPGSAGRPPAGPSAAEGAGRAAVAPRAAAAPGADAGWSVQLGVFSRSANAARLVHKARSQGFPARVSRSSRGLYRVALDGLPDRGAAEHALRRLRAAGLPAAIVGPR